MTAVAGQAGGVSTVYGDLLIVGSPVERTFFVSADVRVWIVEDEMRLAGTHVKDPSARLDYQLDWTDWLDSDTIASSTWTADSGITIGTSSYAPSATTKTTKVWLSGGTAGSFYRVTNQITTTQGRIEERSLMVEVSDR